jgi:hypothetical protein
MSMSDPATFEAALPALERRFPRREPPRDRAAIDECLNAIEAEAGKWLGGRHSLVTRHVDTLRKLLA